MEAQLRGLDTLDTFWKIFCRFCKGDNFSVFFFVCLFFFVVFFVLFFLHSCKAPSENESTLEGKKLLPR